MYLSPDGIDGLIIRSRAILFFIDSAEYAKVNNDTGLKFFFIIIYFK